MTDNIVVVFVHGAGTGSWIWQSVRESLPIQSTAVDVDGRHRGATPPTCAQAIVEELDAAGIDRVALVLHSLAGVLAPELAQRLGQRLETTIFVSAVVPAQGKRFVDAMGFPANLILPILFKFNRQGLVPSESMLRREYCEDLSSSDANMLVKRYQAEWPGLYLSRVQAAGQLSRPVYIKLLEDRSVPPKLQNRMIGNLKRPNVVSIDAGHMVMLSKPGELAKVIMDAVQST